MLTVSALFSLISLYKHVQPEQLSPDISIPTEVFLVYPVQDHGAGNMYLLAGSFAHMLVLFSFGFGMITCTCNWSKRKIYYSTWQTTACSSHRDLRHRQIQRFLFWIALAFPFCTNDWQLYALQHRITLSKIQDTEDISRSMQVYISASIPSYKHSLRDSSFTHSWRISRVAFFFTVHYWAKLSVLSQTLVFFLPQLPFCSFSHVYATLLELVTPDLEQGVPCNEDHTDFSPFSYF